MANWIGEPIPERQPEWRWLDHAVILACFVILVVIGVWQS